MLLDSLSNRNLDIAKKLDIDVSTAYVCKIGSRYIVIEDIRLKNKITTGGLSYYTPTYVEARIPTLSHDKLKNCRLASIMYFLDARGVLNVSTDTPTPVQEPKLFENMLEYIETIASISGVEAINFVKPKHHFAYHKPLVDHDYEFNIATLGKDSAVGFYFKRNPAIYNLRSDFEGLIAQAQHTGSSADERQ